MTIGMTLRGADGSTWNLRTGRARLATGVSGLGLPSFQRYTRDTAPRAGQRFIRAKAGVREFNLPFVFGPFANDLDWLEFHRAFDAAIDVTELAWLDVTDPAGETRSLGFRLVSDGDPSYARDPSDERYETAVYEVIADDPFYYGADIARTFGGDADDGEFYGGPGGNGWAPDFYLGDANVLDAAEIRNAGDLELWPTYTLTDCNYFKITAGGLALEGQFLVDVGQRLEIINDPLQQVAWLHSGDERENVTRYLKQVGFHAVARRATARLNVQLSGSGGITIAGRPRYFKAW